MNEASPASGKSASGAPVAGYVVAVIVRCIGIVGVTYTPPFDSDTTTVGTIIFVCCVDPNVSVVFVKSALVTFLVGVGVRVIAEFGSTFEKNERTDDALLRRNHNMPATTTRRRKTAMTLLSSCISCSIPQTTARGQDKWPVVALKSRLKVCVRAR